MSDPKRMTVTWKELGGGNTGKTEWVSLEEYKLLEAEVKCLRSASFVTAVPSDDYERVVKAGNALRDDLEALTKSTWFNKCNSVKNWNSATYQ